MEIDQETLETIQRVIDAHAPKYKIPGYEVDDVKQEAFILAMDALKVWEPSQGPLENFLAVHLSNRLVSFTRLKLKLNSQSEKVHKALMSAADIYTLDSEQQEALVDKDNVMENVEREDILRKIDEYLPVSLRRDYLKLRAQVPIARGRQQKIMEFLKALLSELSGDERDEDE